MPPRSDVVLRLALALAALSLSAAPVAANFLTGAGPTANPNVINPPAPPPSPATNPGPVGTGNLGTNLTSGNSPTSTGGGNPTAPTNPGPAANVPGPIGNLGARYSPAVLDMGEIKTPEPGTLSEDATAILTVISPTRGAVSAAIQPSGPFWVKRITSYRMQWLGSGTQQMRTPVQTVAGGGSLTVWAGQELEVEVAFKTAPGDTDRHESTLHVEGHLWYIDVPTRINVTALGPLDLLVIPVKTQEDRHRPDTEPDPDPSVQEFTLRPGIEYDAADRALRLINPTGQSRIVTVRPGVLPPGLRLFAGWNPFSPWDWVRFQIQPGETVDVPLTFFAENDAPAGANLPAEAVVETGTRNVSVLFYATIVR
jgi:hypothetical protein